MLKTPALLTRMSIPPQCASTVLTPVRMESRRVTSMAIAIAIFAKRACRPERFCFQQIRYRHPGTFAGIGFADGTPDAAGTTGYEGDLSFKPFHVMRRPLLSNRCRWSTFGVR